jgi:hypothetical protein
MDNNLLERINSFYISHCDKLKSKICAWVLEKDEFPNIKYIFTSFQHESRNLKDKYIKRIHERKDSEVNYKSSKLNWRSSQTTSETKSPVSAFSNQILSHKTIENESMTMVKLISESTIILPKLEMKHEQKIDDLIKENIRLRNLISEQEEKLKKHLSHHIDLEKFKFHYEVDYKTSYESEVLVTGSLKNTINNLQHQLNDSVNTTSLKIEEIIHKKDSDSKESNKTLLLEKQRLYERCIILQQNLQDEQKKNTIPMLTNLRVKELRERNEELSHEMIKAHNNHQELAKLTRESITNLLSSWKDVSSQNRVKLKIRDLCNVLGIT